MLRISGTLSHKGRGKERATRRRITDYVLDGRSITTVVAVHRQNGVDEVSLVAISRRIIAHRFDLRQNSSRDIVCANVG